MAKNKLQKLIVCSVPTAIAFLAYNGGGGGQQTTTSVPYAGIAVGVGIAAVICVPIIYKLLKHK